VDLLFKKPTPKGQVFGN